MASERIYLDNNATTQVAPCVIKALVALLEEGPGNASSVHSYGQQAKRALTRARDTIARHLGVKSQEIFFTSGGTEAANLLIHGFMGRQPDGHLITSDLEHAAVSNTAKRLNACGFEVTALSGGTHGAVRAEQVREALQPNTKLITLMAVNNETGVKTDLEAIAAVAEERGIPFVVDGVGLMGKERFTVPKGVSAIFFSGHKFHAPQGVGFYFLRKGSKLLSVLTGGGQESGRRAGTENLPGIIGMAAAVEWLEDGFDQAIDKMRRLRDRLENELDEAEVNGEGERTANTTNLYFPGVDGESLLMNLDLAGVAASAGSACSSGALEPSQILLNMGYDRKRASCSLRFSLSRFTTDEEISRAISLINETLARLRAMAL